MGDECVPVTDHYEVLCTALSEAGLFERPIFTSEEYEAWVANRGSVANVNKSRPLPLETHIIKRVFARVRVLDENLTNANMNSGLTFHVEVYSREQERFRSLDGRVRLLGYDLIARRSDEYGGQAMTDVLEHGEDLGYLTSYPEVPAGASLWIKCNIGDGTSFRCVECTDDKDTFYAYSSAATVGSGIKVSYYIV